MSTRLDDLTSQEKFLLEWLGREDWSAYGECEGQHLTVLINLGLAKTALSPPNGWTGVSLTDDGIALLSVMKRNANE